MTDPEFDPNSILQYKPSADEAQGRKPLAPAGTYDNCVIEDIQVYPPSEKYPKPGVLAQLKFDFVCPNYDGELVKRMDFKKPLSRRSNLWKLMNAVWGDQMSEHTPEDLQGMKVNIFITHEWTDGADSIKYAAYNFTNAG